MQEVLPQKMSQDKDLKMISNFVYKSQCMMSRILYCSNDQRFYQLFKPKRPFVVQDWKAYNIMRKWSQTLFTSKVQIANFKQKYDPPQILQLESNRRKGNPQNLYIWHQEAQRQTIIKEVDPKRYRVLNGQQVIKQKSTKDMFSNPLVAIANIKSAGYLPICIQLQFKEIQQIWKLITENKWYNPIDLIMISQYRGQFSQECIGQKFAFKIQDFYSQVWRSSSIPTQDPELNTKGTITFVIYKKND